MSTLRIATQGLLASPLSIASQGFLPIAADVVLPGGGVSYRPSGVARKRLLDDDELILLMFAQAIAGHLH